MAGAGERLAGEKEMGRCLSWAEPSGVTAPTRLNLGHLAYPSHGSKAYSGPTNGVVGGRVCPICGAASQEANPLSLKKKISQQASAGSSTLLLLLLFFLSFPLKSAFPTKCATQLQPSRH